ncbi:MAG: hypothetical protein AAF703_06195 [Cyanobacteria bacterium P01_D01_bin.105]
MAKNSNRPTSNAPEPNPPPLPPSQQPSGDLSEFPDNAKSTRRSSGATQAQNGYSVPSQVPSRKSDWSGSDWPRANPPSVSSPQPHFNNASTFDPSSIRRTTPTRTTSSQSSSKSASGKFASEKSVFNRNAPKSTAPKSKRPVKDLPARTVQVRIPLFFGVGIGLSLLAGGLKAIAAALAEGYLYSLPWVGGFLRSIELAEISNLVVFALLAGGIGAATIWLPRRWNPWAKIGLLLAVSPFVFSASYLMQQRLWIQRVAERSNISYPEAEKITNEFLEQQTGSGGFWGFYPYSTEVAELPTSRVSLERASSADPSQALTRELASYGDPRADLIAYVFERVGWLLRLMYMAIALLTALIYYFKGLEWSETQQIVANESRANANRPSGEKQKRT